MNSDLQIYFSDYNRICNRNMINLDNIKNIFNKNFQTYTDVERIV